MRLTLDAHPIMLAEPSFNSKQAREKAVELLFEKYQVPGRRVGLSARERGDGWRLQLALRLS